MNSYFLIPLILQKSIWLPTRALLETCGHLEVYGLENLKNINKPVIFACNHSSEIDPFMVPATLPIWSSFSPIFYATKEKSFYDGRGWRRHLFGGWFIKMWGGHTAYSGLKDYQKSLSDHINIVLHGGNLCIFPEGGITKDGALRPARGGISYLSERTKCSIIPVSISGVYAMSISDFFRGKRKVIINFGKPITAEELVNSVSRNQSLISQSLASGELRDVLGDNIYKKRAEYVMSKVREGLVEKTSLAASR